jgi:hypothetical protein
VLELQHADLSSAVIDNLVSGLLWEVPGAITFYQGDIADFHLVAIITTKQPTG